MTMIVIVGIRKRLIAVLLTCVAAAALVGCANNSHSGNGKIVAVGAENHYADVISQVGGPYVEVSAILSNPSSDPHTFEASPSIARTISRAKLIVQNGLGYDDFMNQLEQASSSSSRRVITVQKLLGKPDSTPNPHLWYDPATMPWVASAIAEQLSQIDPAHKADFEKNAATFIASLKEWTDALANIKATYPGVAVATTEPVADYLIDAAGLKNATPWSFQSAVMKGSDPSPQDVAIVQNLFKNHQVKAFLYNQQVADSLTTSFADLAKANGIPVIGVYETMPTPGYNFGSWMLAETKAIENALATGKSAPTL